LTASSLNSAVYELLEIFISCLPKVTSILRHLWKTKFQGKLNLKQDQRRAALKFDRALLLKIHVNDIQKKSHLFPQKNYTLPFAKKNKYLLDAKQ